MELDEILEALISEFETTRDALTCEPTTLEPDTLEREDTRESVTVEPDTSEALT